VNEWLAKQPSSLVAFVLDMDVVAAALDRGLETWARRTEDVQFYLRVWLPEIAAGNYVVRNTAFSRGLLKNWVSFHNKIPKGFSSSDNGAIHLVLLAATERPGYEECISIYNNLTHDLSHGGFEEYFVYTKCVLAHLAPEANGNKWETALGSISLWPRLSGWVGDGFTVDGVANNQAGMVLHHNVKEKKDVTSKYFEIGTCHMKKSHFVTRAELARLSIKQARTNNKELYPEGDKCKEKNQSQCPFNCLQNLTCAPRS